MVEHVWRGGKCLAAFLVSTSYGLPAAGICTRSVRAAPRDHLRMPTVAAAARLLLLYTHLPCLALMFSAASHPLNPHHVMHCTHRVTRVMVLRAGVPEVQVGAVLTSHLPSCRPTAV